MNASWECAKKLQEIGLGDGIQLVIDEIPVEYETVRKKVPELWDTHKPEVRLSRYNNTIYESC